MFYNHTVSRLIILLVALQILNMSIDSPNAQVENKTMSLNINYIDTYVEYLSEIVFNYQNAIPETKNRHHKNYNFTNHFIGAHIL